ncbi:hypothetical protein ACFVWZ_30190 [Streptomyces sp. NPDC058200]|uniref:hypothetical protein n=1 Tax=Streptomyces sp. NPDC058200 TaxID=3346378 RepID=UPI0036E845BB
MNEAPTTQIGEVRSGTHTGSGSQYIYNQYVAEASLSKNSEGKTPRAVAEEELLWLQRRFQAPDGFADAVAKLEERGTVLLDGKAGEGRNAAARVLLHRLPRSRGTMRELLPEKDNEDSSRLLDPELIEDEGRLLLDLSGEDDRRWLGIQAELSSYRASVRDRHAGLVVVLPRGVGHLLTSELADLRCVISRPPLLELDIIKRHLRLEGLDPTLLESVPDVLKGFLAGGRTLTEVATFAQYLCRTAADGGSFDAWCARALDALRGQPEHAASLLRSVRKGAPRALLVAAAMLHEARGDAVHRAAALLLSAVDPTAPTRPALQHRPLSERLKDIEARADSKGRVTFSGLELDAAVRTRVWNDLPDLREALREWVGKIVNLPELDDCDRDALVQRFAEQCFACRRPDDLLTLAERWARVPSSQRVAVHALRHGLHSREFGKKFRSRIYDWSTGQGPSPELRRVLVAVCHEDMAVRHPHAALVRLHHLARRENPGSLARDALLRLVDEDHRLRRRMLARLATTFTAAHGRSAETHLAADMDLFLAFSVPGGLGDPGTRSRPLIAEWAVRKDLADGWATVFGRLPAERWIAPAHTWLRAACAQSPVEGLFLDVLVAACRKRGDHLGLLYRTGRGWAAGQPVQDARAKGLPARLFQKISAAQRVQAPFARETTTP